MIVVEKIIKDYLEKALSVPCFLEEKSLDKYVLITKVSSSKSNQIYSCIFSIKSIDSTKYKASILNEQVKQAMDNIIELPLISASNLNNDYESTDTERKVYRYTSVYEVTFFNF